MKKRNNIHLRNLRKNKKFLNRSLPKEYKAKPKVNIFKTPKQKKSITKAFSPQGRTSTVKVANAEIQTTITPFDLSTRFDYSEPQRNQEVGLPDINDRASIKSMMEYMMPLAMLARSMEG